jgi:hypothetical protein
MALPKMKIIHKVVQSLAQHNLKFWKYHHIQKDGQ